MPLPSSAATMSPATRAAIRGSMKTDRNSSISTGVARPDWVMCEAKMLPWSWPSMVVQVLNEHEDQRQDDRQPEAEIGALLGDQLAQLPAVGGQRRGSPSRCAAAAGAAWRRGCSASLLERCSCGLPQLRSRICDRRRRAVGAGSCASPASVSRKNRSSSVASSGVSARIPMPAWASASDSAPTSCSSA